MQSKAFTLMEILITVIIVGVLASVAIPRYVSTVERVRAMEGINLLKQLLGAQKIYRMENGIYCYWISDCWDDLGVGIENFQNDDPNDIEHFDWDTRSTGAEGQLAAGQRLAIIRRLNRNTNSCLYRLRINEDSTIDCDNEPGCTNFSCERLGRLAY
ncbi:MAG: prepilin-type N-terminal cleavage/methylation domain-containing protein [Candidatus Omnitrophica bacterium]|nr:prepilin-type N-terminal cleavage/methylation domain-containing protein [Candidatus Omnitrophota bacterium]